MPIMRGKIQAILTTDAASLHGGGPLWKSEGKSGNTARDGQYGCKASIQPKSR